jgi:hypothetical protein
MCSIEFGRGGMASEPGGRADKLGNEFERLWAVRHLIELIAGKATWFRIEALGDDEKGTEFWVGRPDGVREAHQCKRENGTVGKWSVADLEAKGIIKAAKFQLNRDPSHRFVFASVDKASHLSDLCDRVERCDDPAEFVTHLTATSAGLKNEFDTLCRRLGLDPESPGDAERVVDFLRRFRPEVVDKFRLLRDVKELCARWVDGEPGDVVAALKDLLDSSIGKTLGEPEVISSLPVGAHPRDLAKEPTLRAALDELRDRFDRSYRHLLIGGKPLGRKESTDLATMLTEDDGPRLVLLHGSGGDGKSGVAFEVVDQLRLRGIPCLPLRLDRDRPQDSPFKFGKSLGLPASPASCLAAAAGGTPGVLFLDQVDAIRWTAAHSAHAWDTCERTVAEALRCSNLRVVLVCRSFDLEDDPRIKGWEKENKAIRVKVGLLDDGTVDAVISSRGVSPATIQARQREILRSPQGLSLWLALHEGENHSPVFRTMTDLMRKFWDLIRRRLSELKEGQYEALLEALVTHMDRHGVLSAPRTVVDQWPGEVDALLSMNALVEGRGGRLLFSHQSFLDYLTAIRILRQVHAGTGTVLDWLAADDQSLFRRSQLRQILTLLRDDAPRQFLDSMKDLLYGTGVRFHLQHLAAQMLGHAEIPTEEEIELVLSLLGRPEWVDHVFFQILAGRESWFDALHQRGILRRWLEGKDERKINLAICIVERIVETRGADVESLLLDRGREKWPGRLVASVWRTPPEKLTEGLFDAVVELRRRGEWIAQDFVNWKSLAQASPARCLRMLETKIFQHLDELEATTRGVKAGYRDQEVTSMLVELSSLADSAAAMPIESWDRHVPCYLRVSRLLRRLRRRSRRLGGDPIVYNTDYLARQIRRVLRRLLIAAGRVMARDISQAFWDRAGSESHRARSLQRLIDCCTSQGPDDRADVAIRRLLREPSRFRSDGGDRGAAYRSAWKVLRRYSGCCSDQTFAELQAAVLAHWPAEERDAYRRCHDRVLRESIWGSQHNCDVLECNDLGLGQYLLLSGMPKRRLSPDLSDRLGVFRRKFGAIEPLLKGRPKDKGGTVGSTIPDDRLHKVSDRNWLKIVRREWSSRSRHLKQMEPDRVGEVSVNMFARDLGRVAALQPVRFAGLALRIPVDCDPRYPAAILQALAERKPPTGTPNVPPEEQATVPQIEAIIQRFAPHEGDREFAMSVCRAIRERYDAAWGDDTLLLLSQLASGHADPQPGRYAISRANSPDRDSKGGDEPDVAMFSNDCVRGAAAGAIQAVLFDHPERLGLLRSAIDSLLDDPHPAVRAAAIGLALPLYNINRQDAVDAFLKACSHPDDAVLRAHDLNHFLMYTILNFVDRLRPLIERMVASSVGKVAKAGAAWATLAWAHRGLFDDIVTVCVDGTRWKRMGVAEALSKAVAKGHDRPAFLDQLRSLFDDADKEVRQVASGVFRIGELYDQPSGPSLAKSFLQSRALDEYVDELLYGLEALTGHLKPYESVICGLADRFAGPLVAEARDHRTRRPLHAVLLAKVLLRLYEQSEHDRGLRRKCLNAWDGLLRQGIGYDVLQNVDA